MSNEAALKHNTAVKCQRRRTRKQCTGKTDWYIKTSSKESSKMEAHNTKGEELKNNSFLKLWSEKEPHFEIPLGTLFQR